MASKGVEMGALVFFIMMLSHGATAQSAGCTTVLIRLAPCLNYVTGNSSTPSSSCCSQLAGVVQSQPQCLCSMLNGGGSSFGITINQTLALSLPGACNVQTPSVSGCTNEGNNGPATSPIGSPLSPPAESADDTPETSNTPAGGGGSKIVPEAGGTSAASITRIRLLHLKFFTLFIVSCASIVVRF